MKESSLVAAILIFTVCTAPIADAQASPISAAPSTIRQSPALDPNDPIERIKAEGLNRSQVIETLAYLSNVIGARLTGSTNLTRAHEWTRDKLSSWGLQNAHLEAWSQPFGRGWTLKRFSAQITEPQAVPLIAYPKAWSPRTNGVLTGDVVYVDAKNETELIKYRGRLRGAIVLNNPPRDIKAHFEPQATRLSDKKLLALADDSLLKARPNPIAPLTAEQLANLKFRPTKYQFFADEGAALVVEPSRSGDGGTVFVTQAYVPQPFDVNPFAKRIEPWEKNAPKLVPQIVIAAEQYNRLVRMSQAGERLKMEVNLEVEMEDGATGSNTIAEIPGVDPKLNDEIVMLGGHLDSWHAGTGATDDGAGVAVVMEAVRILRALNLQPRRTIRVALWGGEETGGMGSLDYTARHFAALNLSASNTIDEVIFDVIPPPAITKKSEYEKLSVYFNLDHGTGKIRGIYLDGNEAARPIFREWLAPFRDVGASTVTSAFYPGISDNQTFDILGLPGFAFIQDEIEYETRTHHSNQDVFDRIQADDLKQNAVMMAVFIYNAAMSDEKVPRKPISTK